MRLYETVEDVGIHRENTDDCSVEDGGLVTAFFTKFLRYPSLSRSWAASVGLYSAQSFAAQGGPCVDSSESINLHMRQSCPLQFDEVLAPSDDNLPRQRTCTFDCLIQSLPLACALFAFCSEMRTVLPAFIFTVSL